MKKYLICLMSVLLLTSVNLYANIGWSGNIWPNSETYQIADQDIIVYYQIWKDGVTNFPGPGDSISATLYYKQFYETEYISADLVYNVDVGNNDEYMGAIPHSYFSEGDNIHFYCAAYDSTDGTYSYGTDQSGAGPFDSGSPGIYYIGSPTSQDVTVTFQVDMNLISPINSVSVGGTFNNWTIGADTLSDPDSNLVYTGDVLIPAGSNPSQQYKFINGTDWESIENRTFVVNDSFPTQTLPVVYFNNDDPNNYISQNVTVTINVDITDSVQAGFVFDSLGIYGSVAPLDWDWNSMNNHLTEVYPDSLWTIDVLFPEGSWRYVNFKLGRNGMDLEAPFGENHYFAINDKFSTQFIECEYGKMGSLGIDDEVNNFEKDYLSNYPNPFKNSTTIYLHSHLFSNQQKQISIFNLKGQLVNRIRLNKENSTTWDGKDFYGNSLPNGIYLYKVNVNGKNHYNKMIMIR